MLETLQRRLLSTQTANGPNDKPKLIKEEPYPGHMLSAKGVRPMEAKVKTIVKIPAPTSVFGVRSFMGLATFYHQFVANFTNLAKPLNVDA